PASVHRQHAVKSKCLADVVRDTEQRRVTPQLARPFEQRSAPLSVQAAERLAPYHQTPIGLYQHPTATPAPTLSAPPHPPPPPPARAGGVLQSFRYFPQPGAKSRRVDDGAKFRARLFAQSKTRVVDERGFQELNRRTAPGVPPPQPLQPVARQLFAVNHHA